MGRIEDAFRKAEAQRGKVSSAEETFSGYGPPIIDFTDPESPLVESYRTLRTNIQRAIRDKSVKSILITSAAQGEGRTQTVSNLAVLFSAIEGNKTLLVDADLRHPELHEIFQLSDGPGLSELLHGTTSVEAVIRLTRIGNLKVVPAGRMMQGSAELLNSPRLAHLMEVVKADYDIILFDTPPVIPFTDSVVLASQVDGIILIVRARDTRREVIRRAKDLLDQSPEKFLGVVFNNVEYVIPRTIYEKL